MKKILFGAALLSSLFTQAQTTPCVAGMAGIYPCDHVDLLAHVTLADMNANPNSDNTNDIWGWVSPVTGKEYALVGVSNGLACVDISNPEFPVYIGTVQPHGGNSLWRDVETYNNYAFIVSEASGHGLQVFDLLQLDTATPGSTFTETAYYGGFGHCHTLNIDPVSHLLVAMGTDTFNGGLHLVDITNPLQPVLAGGYADAGYTHDGYIVTYSGPDPTHQGDVIVVACNGNSGWGLVTVNVTDPTDCILLDNLGYAQLGYTHQGWFTKDNRYFLVDDELDEQNAGVPTRTHMFDLNDLDNLVYMGFYQSTNSSIDHNLYTKDHFVYESNYRSGVRILDAIRVNEGILNPVAFFDLLPLNDLPQFSGTWSNYPYLPSGVNIATSMYDGFFILRPHLIELSQYNLDYCNVNTDTLQMKVSVELDFPLEVSISGLPAGYVLNAPTISSTGNYNIILDNLMNVSGGSYACTLHLTNAAGNSYDQALSITLAQPLTVAPSLVPVPNVILGNGADYLFNWNMSPGATYFVFELSTDANFGSIIYSSTIPTNWISLPSDFNFQEGVTYYWHVTAFNDCYTSPTSSAGSFSWQIVGLEEQVKPSFKLYPNPANHEVYIQNFQDNDGRITVFDLHGRVVLVERLTASGNARLDVSQLANGLYEIRIGTQHQKLMVN